MSLLARVQENLPDGPEQLPELTPEQELPGKEADLILALEEFDQLDPQNETARTKQEKELEKIVADLGCNALLTLGQRFEDGDCVFLTPGRFSVLLERLATVDDFDLVLRTASKPEIYQDIETNTANRVTATLSRVVRGLDRPTDNQKLKDVFTACQNIFENPEVGLRIRVMYLHPLAATGLVEAREYLEQRLKTNVSK